MCVHGNELYMYIHVFWPFISQLVLCMLSTMTTAMPRGLPGLRPPLLEGECLAGTRCSGRARCLPVLAVVHVTVASLVSPHEGDEHIHTLSAVYLLLLTMFFMTTTYIQIDHMHVFMVSVTLLVRVCSIHAQCV